MITIAACDDPMLFSTILGIFGFARGIGFIVSGPVSNVLLGSGHLWELRRTDFGIEGFGPVLLYTAGVMVLGNVCSTMYST